MPTDDLGSAVDLRAVPRRVVSIVPSLTEAISSAAPGVLVGATDWCTHPAGLDVVRVRGTKNPDVETIVRLRPELVVANEQENRPDDLERLRRAGLAVWVTAPTTVPGAIDSLRRLLGLFDTEPAWLREADEVWSVEYAGPRRTAVVPIWRRPWMALGRDTFAGDVLSRLGIDNVLADHAERYPRIDLAALAAYDLVVLPDEPYAFSPDDGPEAFPDMPARCVSGRHLTWYGPSLAEARTILTAQL